MSYDYTEALNPKNQMLGNKSGIEVSRNLLTACMEGNIDAVRQSVLIASALAPEEKKFVDDIKIEALHYAGKLKNQEIVREVLTCGLFRCEEKDVFGLNGLHYAAMFNLHHIIKALIVGGLDIDSPSKLGKTPLMLAAYHGHEDVVKDLISVGANVNCRDFLNMTPLHWAIKCGEKKCIVELLKANANPFIRNRYGLLAHQVATEETESVIHNVMQKYMDNYPTTSILDTSCYMDLDEEMFGENDVSMSKTERSEENDKVSNKTRRRKRNMPNEQQLQVKRYKATRDDKNEGESSGNYRNNKVHRLLEANLHNIRSNLASGEITKAFELHGIKPLTIDRENIIESALGQGRTAVLTEAGILALKEVQLNDKNMFLRSNTGPRRPDIDHMDRKENEEMELETYEQYMKRKFAEEENMSTIPTYSDDELISEVPNISKVQRKLKRKGGRKISTKSSQEAYLHRNELLKYVAHKNMDEKLNQMGAEERQGNVSDTSTDEVLPDLQQDCTNRDDNLDREVKRIRKIRKRKTKGKIVKRKCNKKGRKKRKIKKIEEKEKSKVKENMAKMDKVNRKLRKKVKRFKGFPGNSEEQIEDGKNRDKLDVKTSERENSERKNREKSYNSRSGFKRICEYFKFIKILIMGEKIENIEKQPILANYIKNGKIDGDNVITSQIVIIYKNTTTDEVTERKENDWECQKGNIKKSVTTTKKQYEEMLKSNLNKLHGIAITLEDRARGKLMFIVSKSQGIYVNLFKKEHQTKYPNEVLEKLLKVDSNEIKFGNLTNKIEFYYIKEKKKKKKKQRKNYGEKIGKSEKIKKSDKLEKEVKIEKNKKRRKSERIEKNEKIEEEEKNEKMKKEENIKKCKKMKKNKKSKKREKINENEKDNNLKENEQYIRLVLPEPMEFHDKTVKLINRIAEKPQYNKATTNIKPSTRAADIFSKKFGYRYKRVETQKVDEKQKENYEFVSSKTPLNINKDSKLLLVRSSNEGDKSVTKVEPFFNPDGTLKGLFGTETTEPDSSLSEVDDHEDFIKEEEKSIFSTLPPVFRAILQTPEGDEPILTYWTNRTVKRIDPRCKTEQVPNVAKDEFPKDDEELMTDDDDKELTTSDEDDDFWGNTEAVESELEYEKENENEMNDRYYEIIRRKENDQISASQFKSEIQNKNMTKREEKENSEMPFENEVQETKEREECKIFQIIEDGRKIGKVKEFSERIENDEISFLVCDESFSKLEEVVISDEMSNMCKEDDLSKVTDVMNLVENELEIPTTIELTEENSESVKKSELDLPQILEPEEERTIEVEENGKSEADRSKVVYDDHSYCKPCVGESCMATVTERKLLADRSKKDVESDSKIGITSDECYFTGGTETSDNVDEDKNNPLAVPTLIKKLETTEKDVRRYKKLFENKAREAANYKKRLRTAAKYLKDEENDVE